jgi:hypothetical protein
LNIDGEYNDDEEISQDFIDNDEDMELWFTLHNFALIPCIFISVFTCLFIYFLIFLLFLCLFLIFYTWAIYIQFIF